VPYILPYTPEAMRKTSVYLDEQQAERLARLARQEGRSQAEILRQAVAAYQAPPRERDFALAAALQVRAHCAPLSRSAREHVSLIEQPPRGRELWLRDRRPV
jgi:predicted DNA-binding protein